MEEKITIPEIMDDVNVIDPEAMAEFEIAKIEAEEKYRVVVNWARQVTDLEEEVADLKRQLAHKENIIRELQYDLENNSR